MPGLQITLYPPIKPNLLLNGTFKKARLAFLISSLYFIGLLITDAYAQDNTDKNINISSSTKMEFLKIPGGCFLMGSNKGFVFEAPAHKVCVDTFYLGKYEVTQKQWTVFQKNNL